MTQGSIATRYAKALYEEAKAHSVDEDIYEYFGMLLISMKTEQELQEALINPRIPADKKFQLLMMASGYDSTKAEGNAPSLYARFIRLVLDHKREMFMRLIIYVYRDMFREDRQIDRVVIETAEGIDDKTQEHLIEAIKGHTGRKVECELKVNPRIIGGFRLRIGDRRYDCSYKTKLDKIREKLCLTK